MTDRFIIKLQCYSSSEVKAMTMMRERERKREMMNDKITADHRKRDEDFFMITIETKLISSVLYQKYGEGQTLMQSGRQPGRYTNRDRQT